MTLLRIVAVIVLLLVLLARDQKVQGQIPEGAMGLCAPAEGVVSMMGRQ